MNSANENKSICEKCSSEWREIRDICRVCDGSGKDYDPLSFHGCLSCRNGETVDWECDCDPYEGMEEE